MSWDAETETACVACGEWSSYCQGHGMIGDPVGRHIITNHDNGNHHDCHINACQEAWDEAYKQEQADLHNDDIRSGIFE